MHCGQSQLSSSAVSRLQAGRSTCGRHYFTCCQGHQQSQVAHKPRIETARLLMDTQLLLSPNWWGEHCASLPEVLSVERQQGEIRQKNSFIQFLLLRWVTCSSPMQTNCCSHLREDALSLLALNLPSVRLHSGLCFSRFTGSLGHLSTGQATVWLLYQLHVHQEAGFSAGCPVARTYQWSPSWSIWRRTSTGRFCIGLCSHATCISVACGAKAKC